MHSRRVALFLLLLSLVPGCATRKPGDPLKPGYNIYSKEQEVQVGQQAAREVLQQVEVVNDPAMQSYVRSIGERLASTAPADRYPYSFTLINEPSINAFALPGGPVFVHSGLLDAADNEAQFAGVLAHEISHVALRHATNQASKANILQLPAAIAGAVIGQGSLGAQLGQLGLGLGLNALIANYSRSAELEADALGARIMAEGGYNPIEMARFFEKLEAQGGSRALEFLSSHPNPGNRVRAVEAEIRTFPQREYRADSGQFHRIQQLVAALPRRDAQTRARLGPQRPPTGGTSSGFQTFNGGRFAIAFPDNWEAFTDGNQSLVALAPRQGIVQASSGGLQVGYGALASYYPPQRARDLQGATAELIQTIQQGNPGIQVRSNPRRVSVGGQRGFITQLTGPSPYGGAEVNYLVTVARPEGVWYMAFVAPERDFGALQGTFEQMLQSVQFR